MNSVAAGSHPFFLCSNSFTFSRLILVSLTVGYKFMSSSFHHSSRTSTTSNHQAIIWTHHESSSLERSWADWSEPASVCRTSCSIILTTDARLDECINSCNLIVKKRLSGLYYSSTLPSLNSFPPFFHAFRSFPLKIRCLFINVQLETKRCRKTLHPQPFI